MSHSKIVNKVFTNKKGSIRLPFYYQKLRSIRSGYYAWVKHVPSNRALSNQEPDRKINLIFDEHKMRYEVPRIIKVLHLIDEQCSRYRVTRRMKNIGLKAITSKRFKATTNSKHTKPTYDNILNRDFIKENINQK